MQTTIIPASSSHGVINSSSIVSSISLQPSHMQNTIIQVSPKGIPQSSGQPHIISNQNGQFIITTNNMSKLCKLPVMGDQTSPLHNSDAIALPSGNQNQQSVQTVYPVQYIDANDQMYGASNGQIEYIEISNGKPVTKTILPSNKSNQYADYGSMYAASVAGSTTYYQTATGELREISPSLGSLGGVQTQIVTHQGNTYVVQGVEEGTSPITHTTRASPATVQWLIDNYETADGVSLPRSTLYHHYLRHCQEQKIDPMNPASFGKLIRSVFLGLRTRRLGTRGNSKYHYYGIRIKPNSPLNQFTEDMNNIRHYRFSQKERYKGITKFEPTSDFSVGSGNTNSASALTSEDPSVHAQFLGDASSALPVFGEIVVDPSILPNGIHFQDISQFQDLYVEHCENILDAVVNLQFSHVEAVWQQFWRSSEENPDNDDSHLPKSKLEALCRLQCVQDYVRESDYSFYQSLVEVLIPNVLRPIPTTLTQAIRNFAKSLENWMRSSMSGVCPEMVAAKVGTVQAFAQTLRRYTSLNHLAQAARAVLTNPNQINQMLTDLNRVDFTNVQEQASWVCHCDDTMVSQIEQDFKKILQEQNSLEQWADWLESVVGAVLQQHEESADMPRAARHFLLKWSFYSSMVIRDLTLRSAASFGSFHLIRLLYDEYMFYLVEHKVADYLGQTPVAVMGEMTRKPDPVELPDTRELNYVRFNTKEEESPRKTPGSTSVLPNSGSEPPTIKVTGNQGQGVAVSRSGASGGITVSIAGGPPLFLSSLAPSSVLPSMSGSFTASMLNLPPSPPTEGSPPPLPSSKSTSKITYQPAPAHTKPQISFQGLNAKAMSQTMQMPKSSSTYSPIAIPTMVSLPDMDAGLGVSHGGLDELTAEMLGNSESSMSKKPKLDIDC